MKICVLGAGSLGSVIGGALAQSGNEVHLVARKKHVGAMNDHGLILVGPDGESTAPVIGHELPEGIGIVDLAIVLCKSYDTATVISEAHGIIGPETMVMSLQNGLGNEDVLCEAIGKEHVIGGKTYIGGMMLEPGRVQSTIKGKDTVIGELDGSRSERVARVAAAFEEAGMHCLVSDNIMGVAWDKLLINVSTGAVCGITRLPYGYAYQEERLKRTALAAVQEGIDVAHAAGIKLRFDDPEDSWNLAAEGLPFDFKPSILQSLEKNRMTEVDFINGAVVREGAKYGIPTPVNETLTACVMGIERYIREYVLK